jgi:hypothetical protein
MIETLLAVLIAGIFTRIADMIADDGLYLSRYIGYTIGAFYGFLGAYIITQYPLLGELGIAVVLSVLFTSKIDHPVHAIGVATTLFFLAIYGLNPLNLALLSIFIAGGIVDEAGNYLSDKRKLRGIMGRFFGYRLTMEAVTFCVSFYTGNWIIFLAMIAYDAGFTYMFPEPVKRKLIRLSRQ